MMMMVWECVATPAAVHYTNTYNKYQAFTFNQLEEKKESQYCYSDDPHPYHHLATKTSYLYARDTHLTHDTLVPEGCEGRQVWHVVRHGTRYPSPNDLQEFITILPLLQTRILQAHQDGKGKLCPGDVALVAGWELGDLNTSLALNLTAAGAAEVRGLAADLQVALPTLLHQPFTNQSYTFRHTKSERTEMSARAYAEGVFGSSAQVYFPPPLDPDPVLKFYDMCLRYRVEVKDNPEAVKESTLFLHGPQMAAVITRVSLRLGLSLTQHEVNLLYNGCRYYQAWSPTLPSAWCVAFTHHDLKVLEYNQDLKDYYEVGYGHSINYQMACPLIQDAFQHFRSVVEGEGGPKGVFYFTHSVALLTMMTRLGLYQDRHPLTHLNLDPTRRWRTSLHGSFAANVAFTLSHCPQHQHKWWVSLVEGERGVGLEGCEGQERGCTWDEWVQVVSRFLPCNLTHICALNQHQQQQQDSYHQQKPAPISVWWRMLKWLVTLFI
ncbi:hypothetical protein Pcinc_020037 [Petrolisthes cinctipes]|uniref:Multiple inositol polyphosphate phosphatase 1 n=1 Tax=Petrolisthes cinctipes TaxID=88211 RepID=A0AAE1KLV0_PETCI|nr:hypothetical protein Pcinc_020037 [Petrolisthes cinctipes]